MAESLDAPVIPSVIVASSAVSHCVNVSLSNVEQTRNSQQESSFPHVADTNGSLVEDSTSVKLVASLEAVAKSLKKNANHHDHLVALSIVVMGEVGFRIDETTRPRIEKQDSVETFDPNYWRCNPDDSYQLMFRHEGKNDLLDCKLVAVPIGDVLVINLCPLRYYDNEITKTRSIAFSSFKHINPYSSDLTGRFMNLREFSHRFKDNLTTPIKGEILTNAGITNPSLSGLPTELKLNILMILETRDVRRIAQTCREFRDLSALRRR